MREQNVYQPGGSRGKAASQPEELADPAAEHRRQTRGLLALIRAIVRRTSESATLVPDFVAHLNGRLDAIGRVQEILMRDPDSTVDLLELLDDELMRQGIASSSVQVPTESLPMDRSVAATLALALHELATNAIKFGQLNLPRRQARITWQPLEETPGWVVLRWQEDPVAPLADDAPIPGFGFELILQTLPYEIGAQTRIEVTAEGLLCEIRFCPRSAA